jgi:uncharacterized protein
MKFEKEFYLSPIIKAVGETCNLRCAYCYYNGNQHEALQIMDESTLDVVLMRLLEASPKSIRFVWHGGEPTLARIKFYKKVVELQSKYMLPSQECRNSIQTNGTLITPEWVDFFKEFNFGVGISLDGPEHVHNYARLDAGEKGSFNKVMQGINYLKAANIHTGAIAVINSYSVKYPDDIFRFFYENNIWLSANNCESVPEDPESIQKLAVEPMEYAHFLLRLFELWLETDNPKFQIRPLNDLVQILTGYKAQLCKFKGFCYQHITVDTNGDVYPCNDYRKPKYLLGNLIESSFEKILQSSVADYYYSGHEQTLSTCSKCKWVIICKGWCRRTWNGKTGVEDIQDLTYCEALQLIFSTISSRLNSLGYNTIL